MKVPADHLHERIDPSVLSFFQERQAPFGCMNIMDVHIPTTGRVTELTRNALTVDYALSQICDVPDYARYTSGFAERWTDAATNPPPSRPPRLTEPGWFSSEDSSEYARHMQRLRTLDLVALSEEAARAVTRCIDSIHLFCPKQCNMTCTGCYASAIPVDKHPYQSADVEHYYVEACRIIDAARGLGATVVQTSGDGEPTIHPRFFDLLDHISSCGMQWLIYTAGLIFSSELAAAQHWQGITQYVGDRVRTRIQANIDRHADRGDTKPTVKAFLDEMELHRDHLHVYHSVWSGSAHNNTEWRKPRVGDYDYVTIETRSKPVSIPSGLFEFMRIFTGDHRSRLGIDFPVSDASIVDVPAMASFVVDNGLRSYFEPIILTGRARRGVIGGQHGLPLSGDGVAPGLDALWKDAAFLLVRSLCSFRFLHQPIVKFRSGPGGGFFAAPGTGFDLDDLASIGVLDSTRVSEGELFSAIRSPIIVYNNYAHFSGCKCNDFAGKMLCDRAGAGRELRDVVAGANSLRPTTADLTNPAIGEARRRDAAFEMTR